MSLHHCVSQSFALPPATKPFSHLPCPLPPNQSVIWLALYHRVTVPPRHHVSQSFALPPATKPVGHLTCPLPPRHRVTVLVSHLPCPLPPNQSFICLAPCHQTSQSFALPPATKPVSHLTCPLPPCHRATVLVSHLPCPLPPNQLFIWLAPCHQTSQSFALPPCHQTSQSFDLPSTTASPRHCVSQSFALPPATKPVIHLPCPLPPNQSVIWLALYHRITASLCWSVICLAPLPPNQSFICLAPCHQTSQSFDLPSTTASLHHCLRFSPPHGYESDWLMLTSTVLIG